MTQIIKSRVYPQKIVDELTRTKKTLIRTDLEQSNQNNTMRGFSFDLSSPQFLSESNNLRTGQNYSFFEINKLNYDMDKGLFSLDAGISFPNECVEITLYADLIDTATTNVVLSFSHKTKNFHKSLSYDLEEQIFVNRWAAEKFAVIVYAQWTTNTNSKKSAAIFSYLFKDIKINCDLIYPKKEEPYIKFSNKSTNSIQNPPNIPALLKNHENSDNINIALFRLPDDTKDLDYLCEFEKDPSGHPYMCVPTAFDLLLHSGNTQFCEPVKAFCTISSLDPQFGGKYIVTSGSTSDIEESQVSIDVASNIIHVEMLKPWKVPFPYGGSLRPYDFSYEVVVELTTKTVGQEDKFSHTVYAMSSIKDTSISLVSIPHVSIRWGCLEENTLIKMADSSTKPIKDIRIGDLVAGKDRHQTVENVWRGSEEKYVRIVTDKKENLPPLLTTLDHPILTTSGMKRAMNISISDVLISEYGETQVTSLTIEEKNINVCNLSFFEKDDSLAILANGIYVGDFECQNKNI